MKLLLNNLLMFNLLMVVCAFSFLIGFPSGAHCQDQAREPKVDFSKTIKPILDRRCAACHNPQDEEGGVNLEDLEALKDYVAAGKPLESPLFQSLTGSNDMLQMPPEENDAGDSLEPCAPSEIALIYLWIQQGASFEGFTADPAKEEQAKPAAYRIFLFSGYFHPAVVHFPIALITLSAFFIIFFFRNETISDDAAFYLLLFGTLSSVVACVLGWGFADKNPVPITDFSLGINRHRWFGVGATVLAVITTIIGWRARNEVMIVNRSGMWKFGVILTAALMGIVGHQGGEEVYGEGVYERAAEKLIPEYWPFRSDPKEENKPTDDKKKAADQQSKTEPGKKNPAKQPSQESANPNGKQAPDSTRAKVNTQEGRPPVDPTLDRTKNK